MTGGELNRRVNGDADAMLADGCLMSEKREDADWDEYSGT